MLLAHRQHVRMQVDMTGACAGDRESEADHVVAIERTHHLSANLVGNDKHAQRYKFRVGEVPHFLLEGYTSPEILDPMTAPQLDGVSAHAVFSPASRSCAFACCQSNSSSSADALS